jgi:aryl-alcohol dehydrogenase-like predicted oxidoreductase
MNRRTFLRLGAGAALLTATGRARAADVPARAVIPSSGLSVTRVGLGTWRTFDAGGDPARRARLAEVLRTFVAGGGEVVDTSPMYGSSPAVLGDLARDAGLRSRLFLATKVWTSGRAAGEAQLEEQLRRLRTDRVELLQVHNLVDWRTQLATLRRWQEAGRTRHIGITHYLPGAADELERLVRTEKIDFVQFALSLEEPRAAERLLGVCADRGVAFIANRPFAEGAAFGRVRGRELPPWAAELGIATWAQFLLKWILAHPGVTCAIPATGNPAHAAENLAAARGPAPDAAQRDRLAAHWRSL